VRRGRWRHGRRGSATRSRTVKWAIHSAGDAKRISVAGGFTVARRVADANADR